jgi:hypothetical protein
LGNLSQVFLSEYYSTQKKTDENLLNFQVKLEELYASFKATVSSRFDVLEANERIHLLESEKKMEFELKNVQDLVFQRLANSLAQAEGKLKDEMRQKLSQVDVQVSEIAEDQQTIQHNFRQLEKKVANTHFSASGSKSNF